MLSGFHPLVSRWFLESIGEPTSAQRRGWDAIRAGRHTLIAAPTGSGKTLAAFLTAIDDLVREGSGAPLPDEVRVVYVSPLKALSADIHKNLAEPRRGIRRLGDESSVEVPRITAAVRTGDTTSSERAAMLRTPPHILVTTPESLYLLVTAERSRQMLRSVRTVIVDEIHAVIGTRRGAHLALTLERLEAVCGEEGGGRPRLQRIGLSATQKPIGEVARFLVGNDDSRGGCAIVDEGHRRIIDLAVEVPPSPLTAVMAHEVWEEYYDRLAALIAEHKTTLIFVNTRRLAERVARHLSDRLGDEAVTAHHGSLSKERRLDAEDRLKTGALKALVATASLELGIDIGHVDLVCQIGSPHRIATLLQRVGRSGHSIAGTPKGRMLPVSLDDLVECAALLRASRRGELDAIVCHDAPLDVLAQQVTAETSCDSRAEDELFALTRRAWPYRALSRADFDAVVSMVSDGFATPRGRRSALVHRDEINRTLRGRRGSRLLSLVSGGAIPEVADYRVVLEPEDTFIGTVNEDFAIESIAGDIFQLGNASWQIMQVVAGTVRVRDAQGAPPTIPFWLGEAPARSDELSLAVSELRAGIDAWLATEPTPMSQASASLAVAEGEGGPIEWLIEETGLSREAAQQAIEYIADGRRVLGVVPTQSTLVLERFFDEAGGMQLVLHAPFGSRVNRAWALALRKRFCRQFNFELQAAATEDALLLSLGPQHSFPLADVFRYLHAASVRDILVQAFLDAPVFQTRWRWNATISLAVPRNRGGRKVPPQLQRMQADDLMAAVFPDAAACLENIPGDREIPDHPLVNQTVRDCLEEAMDLPQLQRVLDRIHRGEVTCISRDTPEPSAFCHDIINARPYAFVDDAPLEERRTQAVQTRRAGAVSGDVGALDTGAIERVRDEVRPDPRDLDECHDALLTCGFMPEDEVERSWCLELASRGRATRVGPPKGGPHVWVAAERLPEWRAVQPDTRIEPDVTPPPSRAARVWTPEAALVELLRGRLAILGPTTAEALATSMSVSTAAVDAALLALESEGVILRGSFTGDRGSGIGDRESSQVLEWCDRRLLARIHRYTLNRLRAEISPVTPAEFMRFLFRWQHVETASRLNGLEGLRAVIAQLDGLDLPARAWERDVLPARLERYELSLLDTLCLTGEVGWARLSSGPTQVVGATPIALFLRAHADHWFAVRASDDTGERTRTELTDAAQRLLDHLRSRGASFAQEMRAACDMSHEVCREALGELVAGGLVTSDGFAGLRAIAGSSPERRTGGDMAGRWSVVQVRLPPSPLRGFGEPGKPDTTRGEERDDAVRTVAWTLLSRYGVVFRRLLAREANGVTWRELLRVYRTLEARGEIRGGRFVSGMSGEQYALPDAVDRLREVRRSGPDDAFVMITAADPLNLTGIITPGDRIRVAAGNRIVYRNGVPLVAMEGDMLRPLADMDEDVASDAAALAAGRRVPVSSGYVGRLHT